MSVKIQSIALYTLVRREVVRMYRIASQVFLPPVISTTLYFLIFGSLMGKRIGVMNGVNYSLFIAPGLIMMTVIANAYGNVATSLYNVRFQKSVEEMLVSPISDAVLLLGYVLGGVIRGFLVALLVFLISCFFADIEFNHLPMTLLVILLVSALFSLAGFTNAMLASSFDDVMLVPTFLLTPLTYLGGVFYATSLLPPFWQTVSHFNPILYMVNALRHAMIGHQEVNLTLSMSVIVAIIVFLVVLNLTLMKKGIGLRE